MGHVCKFWWNEKLKAKAQNTQIKPVPQFLWFELMAVLGGSSNMLFQLVFIKCDIIYNFFTNSSGKKSLRRILFLRCALMAALGGSHRQEVLHNTTNGARSKIKQILNQMHVNFSEDIFLHNTTNGHGSRIYKVEKHLA